MQTRTAPTRPSKLGSVDRSLSILLLGITLLATGVSCPGEKAPELDLDPALESSPVAPPLVFQEIPTPVTATIETGEPNLTTSPDGNIYLTWIESTPHESNQKRQKQQLLLSRWNGGTWVPRREIATGDDWFVNWADFPSLVFLTDGNLAAHWLQKSGTGTYAYDVRIAFSRDDGETFGRPLTPHQDGTQTEHGFASLLPGKRGDLLALWLDGREFEGKDISDPTREMTLRFCRMKSGGSLSDEAVLDSRVCECCQTSAANTADGIIVAYRDRSGDDVRDIAVVRYDNKTRFWEQPRTLYPDGWKIQGCPVNGPTVAARNLVVAIVWFTVAEDVSRVKLIWSSDGGRSFGDPVTLSEGNPMGRVDSLFLHDGSLVVSWMESEGSDGHIRVQQLHRGKPNGMPVTVASTRGDRSSGFPRMAANEEEILLAYTIGSEPTSVRLVRAKLPRSSPAQESSVKR